MKRSKQARLKHNPDSVTRNFAVSVIMVLVFICIGVYVLTQTKASSQTYSVEPETGNALAQMSKDDPTASGGQAIRFTQQPFGCMAAGLQAPCIGSQQTGGTGWGSPVFQDEFNGTSLDTNKWAPCWFPGSLNGADTCGVMNDSVTLKSNVRVADGSVILTQSSVQENSASDQGALINTHPSQVGAGKGFMMGDAYFAEARVYFPGDGTNCYNWPAWWINGPLSGFSDGEIDVAEMGGTGKMTTNYHYDTGTGHQATQLTVPGYWCDGYHIYGVDRQVGQNVIYMDGQEVTRYQTHDGGADQYLIFNVGYKTGKTPMAGSASDVKVDYVRVWKKL